MTEPTVGATVLYRPGAHELNLSLSDQPLAAIITYVNSDDSINLVVFGKGGDCHQRASVPLWNGEGDEPAARNSWAQWPDSYVVDEPDDEARAPVDVADANRLGRADRERDDHVNSDDSIDREWSRPALQVGDDARAPTYRATPVQPSTWAPPKVREPDGEIVDATPTSPIGPDYDKLGGLNATAVDERNDHVDEWNGDAPTSFHPGLVSPPVGPEYKPDSPHQMPLAPEPINKVPADSPANPDKPLD